jgi:hypothetical protein
VTYRERQRLADIQAAIDAIRSHLQRGDLSDGLVFDAVRIRLLEIGEAVKALARKRMAAGALFRDEDGRVLLVNPTYKPTWDLPGGRREGRVAACRMSPGGS